MRYVDWHGIEAVLAGAAVALAVVRVRLGRRFSRRTWAAPMCLGVALLCAAGSFAAVLGYRPAWDVWCWVGVGGIWLGEMIAVRRRQNLDAARSRENAQRWKQWEQSRRDHGWPPL